MNVWRSITTRWTLCLGMMAMAGASSSSAIADMSVSAADLEAFMLLPTETLTDLGNGPAINGSGIWTALLVRAGDTLTFDYNFLTDEVFDAGNTINDFAFLTVNGQAIAFADVVSLPLVSSSSGFASETGYQSYQYIFETAGSVLVGFGVVNVTDATFDSGLLIDSVALNGSLTTDGGFESGTFTGFQAIGDARVVGTFGSAPPAGSNQALLTTRAVPEPASLVMLAMGSVAGLFRLRSRSIASKRLVA